MVLFMHFIDVEYIVGQTSQYTNKGNSRCSMQIGVCGVMGKFVYSYDVHCHHMDKY